MYYDIFDTADTLNTREVGLHDRWVAFTLSAPRVTCVCVNSTVWKYMIDEWRSRSPPRALLVCVWTQRSENTWSMGGVHALRPARYSCVCELNGLKIHDRWVAFTLSAPRVTRVCVNSTVWKYMIDGWRSRSPPRALLVCVWTQRSENTWSMSGVHALRPARYSCVCELNGLKIHDRWVAFTLSAPRVTRVCVNSTVWKYMIDGWRSRSPPRALLVCVWTQRSENTWSMGGVHALRPARYLCVWTQRSEIIIAVTTYCKKENCFTSLSAQSWRYRDRSKPEAGTMPYSYFECLQGFFKTPHANSINCLFE